MAKYQRYDEYKDSGIEWVGDIPAHWEETPVFSCFDATFERNLDGKETNVLSLSYGNIIKRDVDTNFGLLPESFNSYQIVGVGDIILRLTDLQNDKKSLRVGLAKEKGIITSAYLKLRPKERLDSGFAYRLLHSYDTTKVYYGLGGGLRQSMKFEDFRRLPVLVPPYEEQTQIANFLDHETAKIDTLIDKQKTLIKLLKEKRQAVISHAVTKGLNPDAPMKDSGVEWLGDVPEHWEVGRLKNVLKIRNGRDYKAVEVESGGYPVYGSGGIFKRSSAYLFDGESVLFGRKGTIDKPLLVSGKFWTVDTMFYSEISKNAKPEYIYYQALLFPFDKLSTNTALPSMTQEDLLELGFVIPSMNEQKEISQYLNNKLTNFSNLVDKAEQAIKLMQERRTALISAAVTGKIDVRDWRAPE
ncbi:restriction endonuclease subunit S [Psychrobacter ciconiae]|uniref:restriction endonuclease subunit S n=1 Tax=Psychrobacter ciconiae TaxID=1553449 RepID=UPI00191A39BA|nr:restriction endonuclease subunit S [Psychrobacter ciconiae]